jgi:RNA polymerase subunit RPABC4/transcription elongation factor Spt4
MPDPRATRCPSCWAPKFSTKDWRRMVAILRHVGWSDLAARIEDAIEGQRTTDSVTEEKSNLQSGAKHVP